MSLSNDGPLDTARRLPLPAREPTGFSRDIDQPVFNLKDPITIFCHCNRVNSIIKALPLRAFGKSDKVEIDIDHDYKTRKYSGQLAVSYFPSLQPEPDTLAKTVCFRLGDQEDAPIIYFCPVCGCHVFKEDSAGQLPQLDDGPLVAENTRPTWAVATGVAGRVPETPNTFTISRHINVDQTGDGGLSIWMRARNDDTIIQTDMPLQNKTSLPAKGYAPWSPTPTVNPSSSGHTEGDTLDASCFCGTVKFHVTRPNHESTLPKSQYPDLMIPYYIKSDEGPNPDNKSWWIREDRYLAGTCACDSCRSCSGFDIQSWSFIPRANIFVHHSGKQLGLDFSNLPEGILRSYNSSPGVTREFCPGCGATVFWHNTNRSELIDVSVGLFNAEGARAEDWLDWWKERVSFTEDRYGSPGFIWDPVTCLETGLKGSTEVGVQGEKLRL
ncbi:hypothetical protein VE03_05082 [Pseudogymnoascus sp. 23342-1-I1]|nr:hypothetical protein VE03_05082 [Pseudogymnoascus sp. 23342-1-I1]